MLRTPIRLLLLLLAGAAIISACAPLRGTVDAPPIALASQGSFAVGGTVVQSLARISSAPPELTGRHCMETMRAWSIRSR
jgi:hypothetical protein